MAQLDLGLVVRVLAVLTACIVGAVGVLTVVGVANDRGPNPLRPILVVDPNVRVDTVGLNVFWTIAVLGVLLLLFALCILFFELSNRAYFYLLGTYESKGIMWICVGLLVLGLTSVVGFSAAIACFVTGLMCLACSRCRFGDCGSLPSHSTPSSPSSGSARGFWSRSDRAASSQPRSTTTTTTTTTTTRTATPQRSGPAPEVVKGSLAPVTYETQPDWAHAEADKNRSGQYVVGKNTQNQRLW